MKVEVFDGNNESPFLLVNGGEDETVMRSGLGHKVSVPAGHGIVIGLNGRIVHVAPGDFIITHDNGTQSVRRREDGPPFGQEGVGA
jgi:hypothetical protein